MKKRRRSPQDFLLELGCEELPADYLPEVMRALAVQAAAQMGPGAGFTWRTLEVRASPRRLALLVRGLEPVVRWEKVGPSKAAAFDGQGKPTVALQGFARSQGVPVSSLVVKDLSKGPCVVARHEVPVGTRLAEVIPALAKSLRFPKQMRWEATGTTFARPVRWILALYGSQAIVCRVADVTSSHRTAARRRALHPWLTVSRAADYVNVLRRAGVVLEQAWVPLRFPPAGPVSPVSDPPKAAALRRQLAAAARRVGGRLEDGETTDDLLTHNAFLAEAPTVTAGLFRPEYLTLPAEVIATSMAKHLKAFSLRDAAGRLLPKFLAVLEGRPTDLKTVTATYERIIEARFTDAQFFWREDTKTRLEAKVTQLTGVVFHKQLGSLEQKIARLEAVARRLAPADPLLPRAIRLAKADLVTQMVREFPTLQGTMGGAYARHDQEAPEVVEALRDHYLPKTARDRPPGGSTAVWLSILDRADTLTGFFGIGLAPTSSEDPYGLRRQALGLVRILVEKPLTLPLDTLFAAALESWGSTPTVKLGEVQQQLAGFILDRFRWWATELRGYPRELVDAVVPAGTNDLALSVSRLDALRVMWRDPRLRREQLFPAGKVLERTGRIVASAIRESLLAAVDPAKFTVPEEQRLWQRWQQVAPRTSSLIAQHAFQEATVVYGTLYPQVHEFFEHVFVMDENAEVRRNRLAMMKEIYQLYASGIADLSKLPLPREL